MYAYGGLNICTDPKAKCRTGLYVINCFKVLYVMNLFCKGVGSANMPEKTMRADKSQTVTLVASNMHEKLDKL